MRDPSIEARDVPATGTLPAVVDAARAVVEQHGTPGAMARTSRLTAELDAMTGDLAVVVAAARWTDRYGRAGAGQARHNLEQAVRGLPDDGCLCTPYSQDAGGGYFELLAEYEPACPVHSEHLYDPRTGAWVSDRAPHCAACGCSS